MKKNSILFAMLLVVGLGASPVLAQSKNGLEDAEKFLKQFTQPNADLKTLSKNLRPTTQDYQAVFVGDASKKAEEGYKTPWDQGDIVIQASPNQTELVIWSATTEELKKGKGLSDKFPSSYSKISKYLKDGVVFYRFKFIAPGESKVPTWDGLVYVNGHWVLFPQPWRVLES